MLTRIKAKRAKNADFEISFHFGLDFLGFGPNVKLVGFVIELKSKLKTNKKARLPK
jgi:hypothetical protein